MALEAKGSNPFIHLCSRILDVSLRHAWRHIQGYRQAVRHSTLTAADAGSNPASPALSTQYCINCYGTLAQLVEHLTFNQGVGSSSLLCLSSVSNF